MAGECKSNHDILSFHAKPSKKLSCTASYHEFYILGDESQVSILHLPSMKPPA